MPASEPATPGPRATAPDPDQGRTDLEPVRPARAVAPARAVPVVDGELDSGLDDLPPSLRESASPLTMLVALRQRWLHALPLGLVLAVLAGGLVWFLRPDKYTAYALLRIAPVEQKILQDQNPRPESDRTGQYQKTQVALIKSRPVIKAALNPSPPTKADKADAVKIIKIDHLPLIQQQEDPIDWLGTELKAELVDNTEILRLSLSDRHLPDDLAKIVNAVVKAYMDRIVKGEQKQQQVLLDNIDEIYAKSQTKLQEQRDLFLKMADKTKTGDPQVLALKQKNMLEEYAALKKELAGIMAQLRNAQVKLAVRQGKPDEGGAAAGAEGASPEHGPAPANAGLDAAIEKEVDSDPLVQKQQAELARLEEQLAQIDSIVATPDHPRRVARQREVEAARGALEKVRAERKRVVAARVRKSMQQETEVEMTVLEKQGEALSAELKKVGRQVDSMGVTSLEMELLRNEIDQTELVLKALRTEKERLRVELQSTAKGRVSMIEYADQATVLNKKSRLFETGSGAFGGLFLGLFVVAFREARTRRIYTPAEVTRGLRLRVVGTLPALPTRRLSPRTPPDASSVTAWNRLLIESIDSVRTMLLQGRPASGTSLLMIASAGSGEGKTTLAGHLAASLARAGCRTLLADCDLRNPSLHQLFGIARAPGVCEALTGTARVEEIVYPTSVDRLSFLPAGQYSDEAAFALAQGALQGVFQRLRDGFDFIIVDSSPVLAVPDALMIGKSVNGVVFSIRPGVSQAPLVYAAYERLQELGLPFVGAVVNGVADKSSYAANYQYSARAGS